MPAMSAPQFAREATYRATMLAATKAAEAGILTDTHSRWADSPQSSSDWATARNARTG